MYSRLTRLYVHVYSAALAAEGDTLHDDVVYIIVYVPLGHCTYQTFITQNVELCQL